ncbi:hypothetical protein JVU11DRAFT_11383 [Chiua virens]|nr:hypothetical protein JVU11DRAFT_11383 [Chiua virens]
MAAESDTESSAYKRTHPLSTSTHAQQVGSIAMQDIVAVVWDMSHNLAAPPVNSFSAAVDVLNKHKLSAAERLDISEYLADPSHRNDATLFCKLSEEEQALWLKRWLRMLREMAAKKCAEGGMVSDDDDIGCSQSMDTS